MKSSINTIAIRSCTFILLLSLVYTCNSAKYTYYNLNANKITVTRTDITKNGLKTYLTYGKSDIRKMPAEYLMVKYQPLLGGFEALLTCRDNKIVLIQPYHYFEHFGPKKYFEIEIMKDTAFYKIFLDSTQKKYLVIQSE